MRELWPDYPVFIDSVNKVYFLANFHDGKRQCSNIAYVRGISIEIIDYANVNVASS